MEPLDCLEDKESHSRLKAFEGRLRQKAREQGVPLTGLFELTPRCTLDCAMCYVHLSDSQMKREELTVDQWLRIIDEACDAGMLYATLTGGECLMYPGFRQIYQHLQDRGVLVTVLTNGTLLDEDTVSWLAQRKPQRVQISVYGSSPQGYRAVTGSGEAFHRVDRAIDLIQAANIALDLAVTVSKQMMPDFEAILRYARTKGIVNCHVNPCPFESREETGRAFEDYAPSLDEQVEIFRIQRKLYDEMVEAESIHVMPAERKDSAVLPERGIICSAGSNSFSINWAGKMLPCSVFDFAGGYPLREGFTAVWRRMNRGCAEYLNPRECVGCAYFNVCRFCPAGHYLKVGEGRANPAVCAEGRRMVEEKIRVL
ncbi:MAG: radical SAM protein [Clostridiales bacterium]|nr:radical SAM protein [Clostridiales bacterium]